MAIPDLPYIRSRKGGRLAPVFHQIKNEADNMEYQYLLTEMAEDILIVTIDREDKLNALNMSLLNELGQVIQGGYTDANVKGVILTGKGAKAFAAGADIGEFAGFDEQQGRTLSSNGHHKFNLIERCPKPVVAAVNGFALGGGCELAMACHLRVASENAKFGQPEVNLGILPGYGGTQRLVQLIGKTRALEYLMTGDVISASQALEWGLVNHVVSQELLLPKCRELLGKITAKAPLAIAKVIGCVNAHFQDGEDGFANEITAFAHCMNTADFCEGTAAFLEKRKPAFKGE